MRSCCAPPFSNPLRILSANPCKKLPVEAQLGDFVHNIERMQSGTFRKQGLFIGSGVVEAGCRSVIGQRCKQSGMFWTEEDANAVMALRCLNAGGRLNALWLARNAACAA